VASYATRAFYFDLASPAAYLVAEQILQVLPGPVEWRPVLARELGEDRGTADGSAGGESAAVDEPFGALRCEAEEAALRENVQRRAAKLGLQPLRWPNPFPFDSELAMRVATYAKGIGRTVPFAQAAFRQAFAGGRSLADSENVLIAAAACEMHPAAVLQAIGQRSIAARLRETTGRARELGVREVPAIAIGEDLFRGRDCLREARARSSAATTASGAR
jgi:2-hydroxychromene-2-carboxylate isomerase